jgi:hypothetical protein
VTLGRDAARAYLPALRGLRWRDVAGGPRATVARVRRLRADRPEVTLVTVALMVLWGVAYAIIFKNPVMAVAGALLGFAMGGGK